MHNTDILSLDDISRLLKDKRLYIIPKETGLSFPTLKKLADGKKGNFTYNTLKYVSDYLRK